MILEGEATIEELGLMRSVCDTLSEGDWDSEGVPERLFEKLEDTNEVIDEVPELLSESDPSGLTVADVFRVPDVEEVMDRELEEVRVAEISLDAEAVGSFVSDSVCVALGETVLESKADSECVGESVRVVERDGELVGEGVGGGVIVSVTVSERLRVLSSVQEAEVVGVFVRDGLSERESVEDPSLDSVAVFVVDESVVALAELDGEFDNV